MEVELLGLQEGVVGWGRRRRKWGNWFCRNLSVLRWGRRRKWGAL